MPNIVYIAASLDGFIADKNGGVDWLNDIPNPEQSDFGFEEFIGRIDALIMGRKTFDQVLIFGDWPYEKPVFVLSNTLSVVPPEIEGKAEIISGEVVSVVEQLNARGMQNLYIDGGTTIQSFLQQDLIDELIVTWVSILLGSGVPLFGQLNAAMEFSLSKTEKINEFLVKCHYLRQRS